MPAKSRYCRRAICEVTFRDAESWGLHWHTLAGMLFVGLVEKPFAAISIELGKGNSFIIRFASNDKFTVVLERGEPLESLRIVIERHVGPFEPHDKSQDIPDVRNLQRQIEATLDSYES